VCMCARAPVYKHPAGAFLSEGRLREVSLFSLCLLFGKRLFFTILFHICTHTVVASQPVPTYITVTTDVLLRVYNNNNNNNKMFKYNNGGHIENENTFRGHKTTGVDIEIFQEKKNGQ